jgi:hypothetical protein
MHERNENARHRRHSRPGTVFNHSRTQPLPTDVRTPLAASITAALDDPIAVHHRRDDPRSPRSTTRNWIGPAHAAAAPRRFVA